jgi:hypothetical protein
LKRNFFCEFLQVSVVQFELYLRELDGDFNSIHVRVMHDACESYIQRKNSLIQLQVAAASRHEAGSDATPQYNADKPPINSKSRDLPKPPSCGCVVEMRVILERSQGCNPATGIAAPPP